MFLRRCFLSSTRSVSRPSLCRFSSVSASPLRRRDYMANSDCRPIPLRERVAFLIRLSDLDTAAKHARLAPFAEHGNDGNDACAVDWVCAAIIVAMCKAKRYRDALDLIRYFFKEHKMIPPKGSFSHLLKGVLDDSSNATMTLLWVRRLAQAGSFDDAMDIFHFRCWMGRVEPFGMRLDVSHILIRGLLDLGDFKEAHKLFREIMMRADHKPAALAGAAFMMRADHNPAALAGAAFMEYWFTQGKEEEAMECYNNLLAMELTNIESTGAIALLEVLLKHGKKTQAWSFFHHLLDSSLQHLYLNTDALAPTMLDECFKMGRSYAAIQTFKVPVRKPGPRSFRSIITRLCEQGLLSEADHFYAEMRRDSSISPDVSTYRVLMDAYVKAGRADDVHRISNHMVDESLRQIADLSRLSLRGGPRTVNR